MSAVDGLGGLTSASNTQKAAPDAFSGLTSAEFVEIMFAELTNQDPFEPSDSQAVLDQLNSLRSIQTDVEMMDRLGNLVKQNEFASAATMIGAIVGGVSVDNRRVVGFVDSVVQTSDGPLLRLDDGSLVQLSKVDEVASPVILEPPGAPPGGDDTDGGDDKQGDDTGGDGGSGTDDPPEDTLPPSGPGDNL